MLLFVIRFDIEYYFIKYIIGSVFCSVNNIVFISVVGVLCNDVTGRRFSGNPEFGFFNSFVHCVIVEFFLCDFAFSYL